MYKYVKSSDFTPLGTPINPDDKRTNYRFADKYIPENDESPEELYRQVVGNYVTDKLELETIKEIFIRNNWIDEAQIVQYYIDELDEIAEYGDAYNISRLKIDIADGYVRAGFADVPWGEYNLECYTERGYLIVVLSDPYTGESAADKLPIDEFMSMSRKDFEAFVGQLAYYGNFTV